MTAKGYTQLNGKTPEEVAYFLHDFFVAPLDWAIGVGGELDLGCATVLYKDKVDNGNFKRDEGINISTIDKVGCGTVGCMGAWVAMFFFDNHTEVKREYDFERAVDLMWDFFKPSQWCKALDPVWPNEFGCLIFDGWDDAYNNDDTTTLKDVKMYFEKAIEKLMEMD